MQRQLPVRPLDETMASFLDERLEPREDFFRGNAFDKAIINFAAATLDFFQPFRIYRTVGATIQFFPQNPQERLLVCNAKFSNFLLNYSKWTRHVGKIPVAASMGNAAPVTTSLVRHRVLERG